MKQHMKRLDWITATSTVIPKWTRARTVENLEWQVSIEFISIKTKVSDILD